MDTIKNMQDQCGKLKLMTTKDQLNDILRQAQKASWTHTELLEYILTTEVGNRARGEPSPRTNKATRAQGLEPPPRTKRATDALNQ